MIGSFGHPGRSKTSHPDGSSALSFRTRRKIAEPNKVIYAVMGSVWTAGLGELIWFPLEAARVTRTVLLGRDVVVHYDAFGRVLLVTIGGDDVFHRTYPTDEAESNQRLKEQREPYHPAATP